MNLAHRFPPKVVAAIFFFLLLVAHVVAIYAQNEYEYLRFQSLTTQQGLSRALVKGLAQDENGLMWIATENGLNRYDGYRFEVFRHLEGDTGSLPENHVLSVCNMPGYGVFAGTKGGKIVHYDELRCRFQTIRPDSATANSFLHAEPDFLLADKSGTLWIATTNGLFAYDPANNRFWHFSVSNSGLRSPYVKCIFLDSHEQLWIATDAGLARIDNHRKPAIATITSLPTDGMPSSYVKSIAEDHHGRIWVGGDGGFCEIEPQSGKLLRVLTPDPQKPNGLSNGYIKAVATDSNGMVWVGHDMGISVFDPHTGLYCNYNASLEDDEGLVNNYVKCLFYDSNNIMWIGTDLGISVYDPLREPFRTITHLSAKGVVLSGNLIYSIFEDGPDSVWVGTNGGLNLWNPSSNLVQHFKHEPSLTNSLSSNIVRAVLRDNKGTLWVGTDNGLDRMVTTRTAVTFAHIAAGGNDNRSLNNRFVVTLNQCSDNHLWVGTWGGGVNILDLETGLFSYLSSDAPDSTLRLNNNQIANIFEDSKQNVWLRSGNIFDLKTQRLTPFPFQLDNLNINFFFEDHAGRIWIGTSSQGVFYYQPNDNSLHFLPQHRLLSEGVVVSMLQDSNHDYWIAVDKSLVKMSSDMSQIHVFDAADGLQKGDFNNKAALLGKSGRMYFGGSRGLSFFFPSAIRLNEHPVKVLLTGLKLFNQTLQPLPDSPLDSALTAKRLLILPHNHRELVLGFTGINFTNPTKNQYAFKIDGLQSDWVYTSAENREASYFHLPPGSYTFRVKAANNSGIWNKETVSLKILVLPPWYMLWWVHLIGTLLLFAIIFSAVFFWTHRLRKQKAMLEHKVEKRTLEIATQKEEIEQKNKQLEEASKAKSEFLANMSHEIRTPLNGVVGFTDLVLKTDLDQTQKEYLQIVGQSAEILLNIINDILDFSKIEAGKLDLFIEKADLLDIASQAIDLITFQAQKKGLEVLLYYPPHLPRYIWTDTVRLKQVLVNLLSNAVKFTEKGEIELKIEKVEDTDEPETAIFRIGVRDTGIGIKSEKKHLIFEAFTQEDSSTTKRYGGTGLGLSISNKLLGMMNSRLMLESEAGKGSVFFFEAPFRFEQDKMEDIHELAQIRRVLIVDDNDNNRAILKEMLSYFGIQSVEACCGTDALDLLTKDNHFDVVFLDYHMPDVDGLDTLNIIRESKLLPVTSQVIMWHSSIDSQEFINSCEELGVVRRMAKPLKLNNLVAVLRSLSLDFTPETPVKRHEIRAYADEFELLVVEDNPVNMMLSKSIIRRLMPNTTVHEAHDGSQALIFCENRRPHLIMMDIQMPVLNGYEATKAIRGLQGYSKIPIIALTAGTVKGEKEKCLEAGMNDFVAKPVVEETILFMLEKWLHPQQQLSGEPAKKAIVKGTEPLEYESISMSGLREDLGDDPVFLREFMAVLKESLIRSKAEIRLFYEQHNKEALSAAAHKLKGTAFSVSLSSLSQLAARIEKTDDLQNPEIGNCIHQAEAHIDHLMPQIEQELAVSDETVE
ncbi:two-component regulator propeller domain-containing protein [Bacteroidales bacterium]